MNFDLIQEAFDAYDEKKYIEKILDDLRKDACNEMYRAEHAEIVDVLKLIDYLGITEDNYMDINTKLDAVRSSIRRILTEDENYVMKAAIDCIESVIYYMTTSDIAEALSAKVMSTNLRREKYTNIIYTKTNSEEIIRTKNEYLNGFLPEYFSNIKKVIEIAVHNYFGI